MQIIELQDVFLTPNAELYVRPGECRRNGAGRGDALRPLTACDAQGG